MNYIWNQICLILIIYRESDLTTKGRIQRVEISKDRKAHNAEFKKVRIQKAESSYGQETHRAENMSKKIGASGPLLAQVLPHQFFTFRQ